MQIMGPENQLQWYLLIFLPPREFFFQAAVQCNRAVWGDGRSQVFDRVEQCLRLWLFCSNGSPEGSCGYVTAEARQMVQHGSEKQTQLPGDGMRRSTGHVRPCASVVVCVASRCVQGQPRQLKDVCLMAGQRSPSNVG